jgi:ribonuclease HI
MPTMLDPSEGIAIFSDGSCDVKDRIGGWAWVALDAFDGIECGSGKVEDCTNNQMELRAVSEGLKYLHDRYGSSIVMINSDSKYVIDNAVDKSRNRKVNLDYWKILDEAETLHEHLVYVHVKGHSDNTYNELADYLANKARKGHDKEECPTCKGSGRVDPKELVRKITKKSGAVSGSHPKTAKNAATANVPRFGTQRWKILNALASAVDGLTAAQVEIQIKQAGVWNRNVAATRLGECREMGLVTAKLDAKGEYVTRSTGGDNRGVVQYITDAGRMALKNAAAAPSNKVTT